MPVTSLSSCLRFHMLCVITLERQTGRVIGNPRSQEKMNECQHSFSSIATPGTTVQPVGMCL